MPTSFTSCVTHSASQISYQTSVRVQSTFSTDASGMARYPETDPFRMNGKQLRRTVTQPTLTLSCINFPAKYQVSHHNGVTFVFYTFNTKFVKKLIK